MAKKLRTEEIYLAPDIVGVLGQNTAPFVYDYRNKENLDPTVVDDKVKIYERQVKDWFLNPAQILLDDTRSENGFIVLMVCLAYFEGVEHYRHGEAQNKRGKSRNFFIKAIDRIYQQKFTTNELEKLYSEARCALFHAGMIDGSILIKSDFEDPILFDGNDIKINPRMLLADITNDFEQYLNELRVNTELRNNFDKMYTNL